MSGLGSVRGGRYTATEAARRTAEMTGNSQTGLSERLTAIHDWPVMTSTAAPNAGQRDSGSVGICHDGTGSPVDGRLGFRPAGGL